MEGAGGLVGGNGRRMAGQIMKEWRDGGGREKRKGRREPGGQQILNVGQHLPKINRFVDLEHHTLIYHIAPEAACLFCA
jgi:hypothetical protein